MDTNKQAASGKSLWRNALALGVVAVIATALLTLVHEMTWQRIQQQQRRALHQQLGELIPAHKEIVFERTAEPAEP